jgi:hypothetical protein
MIDARWFADDMLAVTITPPFGSCANAAKPRSSGLTELPKVGPKRFGRAQLTP